jgi:putative methyltransferase (TIGR04325 family)
MKWVESFKRIIRKIRSSKFGWSGDYHSWQEAKLNGESYDHPAILEKVKAATLKVKNGEAAYERDSVLFDKIEYSWPLLSALMWVAAQNKGKLHVVDFGGSLGSTYFQNRVYLNSLPELQWNIVEQKSFVEYGSQFFSDDKIRFFNSVGECLAGNSEQHMLILSCVLPYLEKPYAELGNFLELGFPYILIDNTYFNYEHRNRICVQKVPPEIYQASYPCWLLDYDSVKSQAGKQYTVVSEHLNSSTIFIDGHEIQYRGLLLKIKR